MNPRAAAIHVLICAVVGGVLAELTPVKWLAASLWVSAALFINGSLAVWEDARPEGFDNPDGNGGSSVTRGVGAAWYWVHSVVITLGLAGLGFYVQFG